MKGRGTTKGTFKEIDLGLIDRPDDIVRLSIPDDEIVELAESIKSVGLLQPIVVVAKGERFAIIAGDRRYLAMKKLGSKKIAVNLVAAPGDEVPIMRAVENLQRANLTPIEEGLIYVGLREQGKMALAKIAKKVGKSAGVVQRHMYLLEMPEAFQKAVHGRLVSMTVAEELIQCPGAERRDYLLEMAVAHGVTKAVARNWVEDERRSLRVQAAASEDGSRGPVELGDKKHYVTCDVCQGAVEIMDVKTMGVCKGCFGDVIEAVNRHKSA